MMDYKDKDGNKLKKGDWVTYIGRASNTRYLGPIIDLYMNDDEEPTVKINAYTGKDIENCSIMPYPHDQYCKHITYIDEATAMLYMLEG